MPAIDHTASPNSSTVVYRLPVRDSIEQKIRAFQKQKTALAEDVLGEEHFAQNLVQDDLQFLFAESRLNFNEWRVRRQRRGYSVFLFSESRMKQAPVTISLCAMTDQI